MLKENARKYNLFYYPKKLPFSRVKESIFNKNNVRKRFKFFPKIKMEKEKQKNKNSIGMLMKDLMRNLFYLEFSSNYILSIFWDNFPFEFIISLIPSLNQLFYETFLLFNTTSI